MKKLLEERMVWIALSFLIIRLVLPYRIGMGAWDLNRTIGWGWDYPDFVFWLQSIFTALLTAFLVGYGVLFFTNRKTSFYLSLFHALLIMIVLIPQLGIQPSIIYLILLFGVFVANLWKSTIMDK